MESFGFVYILLLILTNVVLWLTISKIPRLKHKNMVFLISSFVLALIFLSVCEPYSDMAVYEKFFRSLNTNRFETISAKDWEILFRLLLYGIKFITDDVQIMRIIIAIITLVGPLWFIKRYSKNYLLSVIMFITIGSFYMQFYILRQAVAISIFLFAFQFITDKKIIKFCLSIAIAAMFHKTAIILLLLYPLVNIPPSRMKKVIIGTVSLIGLIVSPLVSSFLTSNLYPEYYDKASGRGMWLLAFYASMYIIYMVLRRKTRGKEKSEIEKTTLFTMFWQFYATQNSVLNRLANYARDSFCILVPNAVQGLSGRRRVLFSVAVITVCIGFVVVTGAFSWYNIM